MTLLNADARHIPLADRTVQCVVTSPPYWGLRDYGTARWEGGEPACDHRMKNPAVDQRTSTLGPNRSGLDISNAAYQHGKAFRDICGKCGATRIDRQIGLEQTPDAYVAELVAVFREVRRVLRDDGVLWLNLGDSYAATTKGSGGMKSKQPTNAGSFYDARFDLPACGIKPKDLVGIPWRVAFALQADGWYLRSDVIWHKPNPMPESVTDRPTKSHEYVFLLTKSERYYYDAKAISERAASLDEDGNHIWTGRPPSQMGKPQHHELREADPSKRGLGLGEVKGAPGLRSCGYSEGGKRNARTVWTIATQPYSGAHFATFPEALVERCVLAGSKAGDCVFDPFGGSGTTARVALRLGRKAVVTELNPAYLALAEERTHVTLGLPLGA